MPHMTMELLTKVKFYSFNSQHYKMGTRFVMCVETLNNICSVGDGDQILPTPPGSPSAAHSRYSKIVIESFLWEFFFTDDDLFY